MTPLINGTGDGKEGITDKLDGILVMLFIGVVFFSGLLMVCAKWFPNDGQTFQVFAALVSGFSGALFTRIKPRGHDDAASAKATSGGATAEVKNA